MAHHTPNRRSLTDEETAALDEVMAEYHAIRERARTDLIAARNRYQEMIVDAADRRDERIVTIIDAAGPEGRGTLARVIEHLKMNRSYLMGRLRKARQRLNDKGATPRIGG